MGDYKNGNIQRQAFQLTINNPGELGFDHITIKKTLIDEFPTLRYFCMADEISASGTYHTHVYVYFSSRVRWNTVKKHFEGAHIEIAKGTVQSNVEYIKKSGKWLDTEKAETKVVRTFEEWGELPKQKGKRPEMEELFSLISEGYSNSQILALNNDYIMDIDKLDKVRTTLLIDKYKGTRRLNLKVIYISGETGTGKTRGVLDEHGDEAVYRVTDYLHPFDSYSCQEVIAFDEFRSGIRISDMLNYLDVYPLELPARFTNKYACYNTAYLISNWSLEDQYHEVQESNPESWKAFLRRIHEVRIYNEDGSVDIYDSVDKYMNRKNNPTWGFTELKETEYIPF